MTNSTTQSIYDYSFTDQKGKTIPLSEFRGRTLLIVNVASKCGFTNQYAGLEALHKKFKDKGFLVIGFPCNQFGGQEPGSDSEISEFCSLNFGVTFPLSTKVEVNGENEAALFTFLKSEKPGLLGTKAIKWNFTKFLVGKDGQVVARFAPQDTPEKISEEISKVL